MPVQTFGILSSLEKCVFKKLLVIGKTGTGKSTLCNKIAGREADDDMFPVSADAVSCTQSTKFATVHFNGEKEKPISVIDTIGFDDPNNDTDVNIIAELVDKLKNNCNDVSLFAIAVNGQAPRLDGSLVAMIKIFEEMFGVEFWQHCVIIFTRLPMDSAAKNRRQKNTKKSDEQFANDYMKVVESRFPNGRGLRYLFIDALFEGTDFEDKTAFDEAMTSLYKFLEASTKLPTSEVNENVKSEHKKLKDELESRLKDKEELTKKILKLEETAIEALKNRHEDEAAFLKIQAAQDATWKEIQMKCRRGNGFFTDLVDSLNPVLTVTRTVDGVNRMDWDGLNKNVRGVGKGVAEVATQVGTLGLAIKSLKFW